MSDLSSPYYPYDKVQAFSGFFGAQNIPRQIVTYLCDFSSKGYTPPDNNDYPRCRLMKYVYYDTPLPLSESLPSDAQKFSLIYDASKPEEPTTQKGYRIFPLRYTSQSQRNAQTIIRCFMGRTIASDVYTAQLSIVFEILSSTTYENNLQTSVYSRTYAIEQAILEALCGVNMTGVGTYYFDRTQHPDCSSAPIDDGKGQNVGRRLILGVTWKDSI